MTSSGSDGWNPAKILRSDNAVEAIGHLGFELRSASFTNRLGSVGIGNSGNGQLAAFALGQPVLRSDAVAAVGSDRNLDALIATGAAEVTDSGLVELDFEVLSDGRSMAILPFLDDPAGPSTDSVYAGSDSWLLVDRVWQYALGGDRAIDLGTGTGLVASFLTTRYSTVIGSDLNPKATQTARLSRQLLAGPNRTRLSQITNDVAGSLLPGAFDLVCVNAPWVPSNTAKGRTYCDGGATGFELPGRFLLEGSTLLTSDGVLVALCADVHLSDGTRPLRELLDGLESSGFATQIIRTPPEHPFHVTSFDYDHDIPGLGSVEHVTVVVHRSTVGSC